MKDAVKSGGKCNVLVGVIETIIVTDSLLLIRVTDGSMREIFIRVEQYSGEIASVIESGDLLFLKRVVFAENKFGEFGEDSVISKFSNLVLPYPDICKY